jgi:hypothetical protein
MQLITCIMGSCTPHPFLKRSSIQRKCSFIAYVRSTHCKSTNPCSSSRSVSSSIRSLVARSN